MRERSNTAHSLLGDWKRFIVEVEAGYGMTIYDYENDLTVRDLIQQQIESLSISQTELLDQLDAKFRTLTRDSTSKSDSMAWWTSRIPLRPRDELLEDIEMLGL